MRTALMSLGVLGVLLGGAAAACGGDEVDCDCAEVGCFADMCTKTVFVLAAPIPADFGGVAGADQLCAQQAAGAKLSGTYRAWLSDGAQGPFDRFSKSTVPYVLPDGSLLAEDWESLSVSGPATPIDMSAAGVRLEGDDDTHVWSGTGPDGRSEDFNGASNFCMNWSRNVIDDFTYVGYLRKRDKQFAWTQGAFLACTGTGLLYCFQQ